MSFKSRRLINLVLTVLVILSLLTPSYSNYSSAAGTGKILNSVAAESHDNNVKDIDQTPASQEYFLPNTVANDDSDLEINCVDEEYASILSIGNKTTGRKVTESLDSIDIDETYYIPALPGKNGSSDGDGVYVRHISHMPKEIKPIDTQQDETELKAETETETETETFSGLNSQTVIDEVYNVDNLFSMFYEEDQIATVDKINDHNYLYNESVVDNTYKEKDKVKNDFPIKNKSSHYKAGFSSKSGLNLLEFSCNDRTLYINPKDSNTVSGKVYANTISFNEIYKETDFQYTVEDNRLKEDIIVKKYTGQKEFYFEMSVVNAVYEIKSSGEISFYEPGTTNKLFWIAKPFAVDKDGERCDLVSYSISKEGLIVLKIDPEWLRKAAYPIVIDPTIYIGRTYQASLGFSNIQGQNCWYYEELRSTGNYYQMTWDSVNNRWKGTYTWTLVGSSWQHPSTYDSVRTWRAPYSGAVSITGNVHKNNTNSGDGVRVKINRNSTKVWPSSDWQNIAYNDTTGVDINFNISVNAGDNIRFIMNQRTTDRADETHWDPVISYVSITDEELGMGIQPYWNYNTASLGGGWNTSVNTFNLNLLLNKSLFSTPGRGLSIGEGITYNSLNSRSGPLGNTGWYLGSDSSLIECNDGSVVFNGGDGSSYLFTQDGSGGYIAPSGIYLTLQKTAPGNFTRECRKFCVNG